MILTSAVWGGVDLHWGETVVVPPPCEPASLSQVKQRLRIAHTADDADLQLLLVAARRQVELDTSAVLVRATIEQTVDAPPADATALKLTRWPVQTIVSVTSYAEDGTATVMDPAAYQLDAASRPARVILSSAQTWPATRAQQALAVRFVAGFAQPSVPVATLTWDTGVATIVTTTPHQLLAGQAVTVRGAVPEFYNGTFLVLSTTDATTLTAAMPLPMGWPTPAPATGPMTVIDLGTPETYVLAVLSLVQHWWDPLRRGLVMPGRAGGDSAAAAAIVLPFGYDTLTAERLEWLA